MSKVHDVNMSSWDPIRRARCVALTTYKKDGTPVTTPMWVAVDGNRILTTSDFDAWKLKRIQRNPRVRLAPCTIRGRVTGDFIDGRARVMTEAETESAIEGKKRRYAVFRVMVRIRKPQVGIEITPEVTS
jgi:PPOX class probable F420-dependent enzyme